MTAVVTQLEFPSLRSRVTPEEWQARVDLAAMYRLTALKGWSEGLGTHIGARVPGTKDQYLLNPTGLLFEEINASCLIKLNYDGEILSETSHRVNNGGMAIHSAVFMARPDINFSLHTHTSNGMAISAMECGLMSISMVSMRFHKRLSYHDYYGQAGAFDDRELIGKDLGNNYAMILKNHGLLAVGKNAGEAVLTHDALEYAIDAQLKAMASGAKLSVPPTNVTDRAGDNRAAKNDRTNAEGWKALIRKLDRVDPSYRD
jgi:ribulose-5-phosphate 4-epimerase/fuculose-1-phosphate aldolase